MKKIKNFLHTKNLRFLDVKKKGQYKAVPGSAAGALIGIITLVIIFYIILIPPAEREKLLGDEATGVLPENILVQEYVGRLSEIDKDDRKHLVPNVFLKEVTESTVLAQENAFIIKKGLSAQYKTIEFFLEDPEHVDNVLISFNTPTHTGILKVIFNSHTVFEGEIDTESPQPVRINKNYLQDKNIVQLEVHGFGVPAKVYAFENFRIIGDITNIQKQEASHLISIPSAEYDNIEKAYIDYIPYCNQNNVGMLELYLNGNELFSGVPNCNSLARISLYKEDLNSERNEIAFRLLKGTINIEQIRLKTFLKTKEAWSKYFYVNEKQHKEIKNNKAMLEINFADDGYLKEVELELNGEKDSIKQNSPYFVRDVSEVVKKGNNYISIKPETDVNILNLEVRIE